MRFFRLSTVLVVAFGLLSVAAGRQLALLVELNPFGVDEGGTQTEIVVRVAPEDRFALGEDVMLWAELSRDGQRVVRRGWALKVEDRDEPFMVELVVPPGPHTLRVDLEGSAARSKGVWWGDVDLSLPASESESETEPVPVPVPDDPAAASESATAAEIATSSATAIVSATESVVAAGSGAETVAATESVAKAVADPIPHPDAAPVSEPDPAPVPASVPDSDAVPVPVSAPAPEPDTVPDVAPAPAVDPPILVIAVDLHEETGVDVPWIGHMAVELAQQTAKAPDQVLILSQGGEYRSRPTSWRGLAEEIAVIETGPADELPTLVSAALKNTVRDSDSIFVLVLTDGLGPRSKKAWTQALMDADDAGAPVLIAGVWNDGFSSGARKNLRKLADVSDGSVFYLQGPEQTDALVERFVAIIQD